MGRPAAPEAPLGRTPAVFATPPLEVNLLCRLALARYLCARLPRLQGLVTALLLTPGLEQAREESELQRVSRSDWSGLHDVLSMMAVVDPTCGEGDVLLGMLDILARMNDVIGAQLGRGEGDRAARKRILERNLYGVEVQPTALDMARRRLLHAAGLPEGERLSESNLRTLNLACGDSLVERDPFTWKGRFGEVMASGGFHLVVGNPPYLRHEKIGDPLGRLSRDQYRDCAVAAVYSRLSRYFEGSELRAHLACPLDGRADLCTLFALSGLGLLRPAGALAFVLPTGLFEARYGQGLERFLECATREPLVVESRRQRSFLDAGVNTSILLTSRSEPGGSSLRRVAVDGALDDLDLRDLGGLWIGEGAPPALERRSRHLQRLMERIGSRLVPLSDLGRVRYPVKTGNNRFFYPDLATADAFGIEPQFRRPVLRSPRDVTRLAVCAEDLPTMLFACDRSLEDLEASGCAGAGTYIRWGAEQRSAAGVPWPLASSVRNRRHWYAVPLPAAADIIVPRFYDRRFFFVSPRGAILEDQTFYGLRLDPAVGLSREICAAMLNCSLTYFLLETSGRTGLGYGVRQYALCDVAALRVPDPGSATGSPARDLLDAFDALSRRPIHPVPREMLQSDRQALDEIAGEILGMGKGEMRAIRDSLVERVEQRLERARRG